MRILFLILGLLTIQTLWAQDVVPKAKTREQHRADRKKMTLEQKIESTLPIDVNLPSANLSLPGNNKISNLEDAKKFVNETMPNYGKDIKDKSKKNLKYLKRQKAKVFDGKKYHGIAVEKTILKSGSGRTLHYREFYILKDHQSPLPYRRIFTWFDHKNKRITEVAARDTKTNSLLHGPYREYRGENLVKEGYYHLGVKDGRWMEYDRNKILIGKEIFKKGFYAESLISYYGGDSTKIKEIMPSLFGKTTGDYYRFHEDGTLAERGQYDNGVRVDVWVEYYVGGNRTKKRTQYPTNFYTLGDPYTLVEYDDKGKVTYEHKK